ncbi:hypothetical protein ACFL1N_12970 [Thermodesulfobacteriota bacterium]
MTVNFEEHHCKGTMHRAPTLGDWILSTEISPGIYPAILLAGV